MRILVFSAYFWPHKGGVEKYVEETAVRLIAKGHKVAIVTSLLQGTRKVESYKGIQVFRLYSWEVLKDRWSLPLPRSRRVLRSLGMYDAVITHTRFYPLSLLGAWFARKRKIPHLHIEHGTAHTGAKPFVYAINWLYDHALGWLVLRLASKVAGISRASELFAAHLCKKRTVLLPNAINSEFFVRVPSKKPFREKAIVFVGRLIEAKGVQDLIAATSNMTGVKVVIVGAGNYAGELRKRAHKNVLFLGEKDAGGIREVLSFADVFVNPSYAEGLPTSVLEAGSVGVPVIATDVGGTREIIRDGQNGVLVKPSDVAGLRKAIEKILADPNHAQALAQSLQAKVRAEFDWGVTVQKLERVLDDMK